MNERPSSRRRFSWALAFLILGLAAIAAAVFIFDRCSNLPGHAAKGTVDQLERVGRDLRNAIVEIAQLQPRVTINDRVYFEQSSPINELALASQRLEVEHEFLHTWAGSTKRLRLHGTFTAKAGLDLRQDFSVSVQPEEAIVRLPHARVLGVEQNTVDVLAFENGYWNPISGADVQSEIAMLTNLARERANERQIAAEAEQTFRAELAARLKSNVKIRVDFYDSAVRE
jgi:hypothetical protein